LQFKFVGRERGIERLLEVIKNHLESVSTDRKTHFVPVAVGSPGIGKVQKLVV